MEKGTKKEEKKNSIGNENGDVKMEEEEEEKENTKNNSHLPSKKNNIKEGSYETLNTSLNTNYSSTTSQSLESISSKFNPRKPNLEYLYNLEYLDEMYPNFLLEEYNSKNRIKNGYMNEQTYINFNMRAILVDWLVDVHYRYHFKRKTLFQTILLIDLYLSKKKIEREKFQLLGSASLFIAVKQNEIYFPPTADFVHITDDAYSVAQLIEMEKEILKILNFEILTPTADDFYHILSKIFNFNIKQINLGEYFLESSLVDYFMITKYQPSIIGVATIYIVMKYCGMDGYKELYSSKITLGHFNEKQIKECAKDLCFLVRNLAHSNIRSVRNKFSSIEYGNVAEFVEH